MADFALLLDDLKRHEGYRKVADCHVVYDDVTGDPIVKGCVVLGYPTIGYGRNAETVGLTEEEAEFLLTRDAVKAELAAADWLGPAWNALGSVRQGVVANMCFNLGPAGLARFVKFGLALQEGRWEDAAAEMLDSKWATQVGARATELAERMRTGLR